MNNTKWLIAGLLAIAAIACDPYSKSATGTPNILLVTTSSGVLFKSATAPAAGATTWSANTQCWDTTAENAAGDTVPASGSVPVIWVTFDRLLQGNQIQATPDDCTPASPAGTPWLTITPAAPTGFAWFTCYNPSAPSASEGGSVVVYLAPTVDTGQPLPPSTGWGDAVDVPASLGPITMKGTLSGQTVDLAVNPADATDTPALQCDSNPAP